MRAGLPRAVVTLGVVSLLTDLSSEMIYPLLPVFIAATLAGGAAAVGLVEGVAEATAALLKLWSGALSDRLRRRKPLVVADYALAGLARPLVGLATSWGAVLAIRFADRIGKGLRSSPRDAMLADATPLDRRGRAYGFHRAMDHAGAVLGPLVAAGLLAAGLELGEVFLLAAVPGALAVAVLAIGVDEPPRGAAAPGPRPPAGLPDPALRRLLAPVAIFTLGNASDAFLLLGLSTSGVPPEGIAIAWSALHVVKATATYVGGRLADRCSRRRLIALGWLIHAATYLGFALVPGAAPRLAIFLAYGLSAGLVEPAERAWVAELAGPTRRGAAFGWFHATVGLCALPASALFGLVWHRLGAPTAFAGAAGLALIAVALLGRAPDAARPASAAAPG